MEYLNITETDSPTPRTTIRGYDENYEFVTNVVHHSESLPSANGFKPVYGNNGDVIQLTMPSWSSADDRVSSYIRIVCDDLNENSIITINEEIGVNRLKDAVDLEGSVYNDVGYKSGTRISASNTDVTTLEDKTDRTDLYATGYIRVSPGDIIRLKNIKFFIDDEWGQSGVFHVDESKNKLPGPFVGASSIIDTSTTIKETITLENGSTKENITYFVVNDDGDRKNTCFIRIVCQNIDETSIITVNEEITDVSGEQYV
jgi:hypothetical protein